MQRYLTGHLTASLACPFLPVNALKGALLEVLAVLEASAVQARPCMRGAVSVRRCKEVGQLEAYAGT